MKIDNPALGSGTATTQSASDNSTKVATTNYVDSAVSAAISGIGDVIGGASSTDNAIARYDGTTGKLIQNSAATIDDNGTLQINTTSQPQSPSLNLSVGASSVGDGAAISFYHSAGERTFRMYSYATSTNQGQLRLATANASAGFDDVMTIDQNKYVGIGTTTPTSRFEVKGTDSNITLGAHIKYTGSADSYPLFQQLNWTHDNISMNFDSHWNGSAWISSDSGSNYQIYKISDQLRLNYAAGYAAGGSITWNTAFALNSSGNIGIGTTSPTEKITIAGNLRCYGVYADYVIYIDQKTTGTPGGTSAAGWQTRALNWIQEEKDSGSYFSGLGSNQFQLSAGRYFVEAFAPSYNCRRQKLALINVTDSTVAIVGDSGQHPAAGATALTCMRGAVYVASTKAFELRHFIQDAVGTYGLGVEANASGYIEKYATVIVTRLGN